MKLLGRTDIEDSLKRLDRLIQEEFQMVTAQILKVATEGKDGMRPYSSHHHAKFLYVKVPTKPT